MLALEHLDLRFFGSNLRGNQLFLSLRPAQVVLLNFWIDFAEQITALNAVTALDIEFLNLA